jgi:hypothetical protein
MLLDLLSHPIPKFFLVLELQTMYFNSTLQTHKHEKYCKFNVVKSHTFPPPRYMVVKWSAVAEAIKHKHTKQIRKCIGELDS